METAVLREKVKQIKWYHTIDLGNGIVTPGFDNSPKKLKYLGFPGDLSGKSVLDIGAWDGFFSFEAEKRGASRVLATDSFCWATDSFCWPSNHSTGKAGFDLARQVLSSHVEEMQIDVLELSPDKVGTFDLVLFTGVLYHMRYPLLALERAASVTRGQLILETVVDCLHHRRPMIAFYPGKELANDESNWCGPNPAAVIGMLKSAGFSRIEVVAKARSFLFRLARALYYKKKYGHPFLSTLRTSRMVFHAWK